MANYESVVRRPGSVAQADIDAGLRAYMNKVYGLMGLAMVITGALAYVFGNDLYAVLDALRESQRTDTYVEPQTAFIPAGLLTTLFFSPVKWAVMFGPLVFVFLFSAIIPKLSASTAKVMFFAFAAFMGISISTIFAVYTSMSIATAFFMAAIMFLSLSLIGYTTKRDLSAMGVFLTMALIGLVVASLVNFFFIESTMFKLFVDVAILVVVAGLTAYYTQEIKNQYLHFSTMGREGAAYLEKGAIMGALSLYIMFLNMFLIILQFVGAARE